MMSALVGAKSPEEAEGILRRVLAELKFSPLAAHTGSPWNILKHNGSLMSLRILNVLAGSVKKNPAIIRDLIISNRLGLLLANSPRGVEHTRVINRLSDYVGMSDEAKLGLQKVVDNLRENPQAEASYTDAQGNSVSVGTEGALIIPDYEFTEVPFIYNKAGKYTSSQKRALQDVETPFVKDASGTFYFAVEGISDSINEIDNTFAKFKSMIKREDL